MSTPYAVSSDLVSAYPAKSLAIAQFIDGYKTSLAMVQNTQAGTSFTFSLADFTKLVTLNNAAAVAVTLPLEATVAWETGTQLRLLNLGAGTVTVAGAVGVTINGTPLTLAQYKAARLIKTGTNTWTFIPFSSGAGAAVINEGSSTNVTFSTLTNPDGDGKNYRLAAYTTNGTLVVSTAGAVQVLGVGGGGGGGLGILNNQAGGGGGGGGLVQATVTLAPATYTCTVGAGGASASAGGNSGIVGVVVGTGGFAGSNAQGGASGVPTSTAVTSNAGGVVTVTGYPTTGGGGGGGNTAVGATKSSANGGAGGAGGTTTFISGSVGFSGGGGGGRQASGNAGTATQGGGGGGSSSVGTAGSANRGGGGGGGASQDVTGYAGGAGGSGAVYIRWEQ